MINKQKLIPYKYLFPAITLLIALLILPILQVVGFSFFDNVLINNNPKLVGFANYVKLFQEDLFRKAMWNTTVFTVGSVIFHIIIGLFFASLLNQDMNPYAKTIFRIIFILPWIFTASVVAVNWQLILSPLGIVNYLLRGMGIISKNIEWFGDPAYAMGALIVVNIWRGYPFMMISVLAGLQSIPHTIQEAALVDGANVMQRYFRITLPQLKPILVSVGLLDLIFTFRLFPLIWLTTGGGPVGATETLATYLYKLAFYELKYSKSAALAVIILLFTSLISIYYLKHQKAVDE